MVEFDLPDLLLNNKNCSYYHFQSFRCRARADAIIKTLDVLNGQGRPHLLPTTLRITFFNSGRPEHNLINLVALVEIYIQGFALALGVDAGCFSSLLIKKECRKKVNKMIFEI